MKSSSPYPGSVLGGLHSVCSDHKEALQIVEDYRKGRQESENTAQCIVEKRKVLVFCHWPCTEQQVEAFPTNQPFRILLIRSSYTLSERKCTRREFNDPDRQDPRYFARLATRLHPPGNAGIVDSAIFPLIYVYSPLHNSEVIVMSIRVSSSSVNLRHGCSDIIFVDIPPNRFDMQ